jgi:hypothetical protein
MDPTVRKTRQLPDGREVEAEAEQHGSLVRLRARLCRDGVVTATYKVTSSIAELLTRREFLPKEFSRDPEIAQVAFEPVEEVWRARLRFFR